MIEKSLAIHRRTFACGAISVLATGPLFAMLKEELDEDKLGDAVRVLENATASGQVRAAVLYARMGQKVLHQPFGEAKSVDAAFLLGSISKPIAVAAIMTLVDQAKIGLEVPVQKYLPEFRGGAKDRVTVSHLLTHVSGLPDQLPQNANLRKSHAPLSAFVNGTMLVPLHFEPGTQYEYSSMAILLATEIAQRITGIEFREFVHTAVLKPLGMFHSAFGTGHLKPEVRMPCQVEFGAIESGGGSPDSSDWDWNSRYWRELGAPWGGAHASASDVGLFLDEFMHPSGKLFRPEIARQMIRNHNPDGMESRGLGLDVGMVASCPNCSINTFGHTGSTGTIAWADPERDRVCVVLTTLPAGSMKDHPRQLASDGIASIPH